MDKTLEQIIEELNLKNYNLENNGFYCYFRNKIDINEAILEIQKTFEEDLDLDFDKIAKVLKTNKEEALKLLTLLLFYYLNELKDFSQANETDLLEFEKLLEPYV